MSFGTLRDDQTTESVVEIDTDGNGIADTSASVVTKPIDGSSGDLAGNIGL